MSQSFAEQYYRLYRMPEDLTQEDEAMSAKITVAREKAVSLKKGLTREKNGKAAKKREYLASHLANW